MNEKEAREITSPGKVLLTNGPEQPTEYERYFIGKGYLEADAQWRERVRPLVEALNYAEAALTKHKFYKGQGRLLTAVCDALLQFRKEEE